MPIRRFARDERRAGLYREYSRDFFDLVSVGECHRGGEQGNWRSIPEPNCKLSVRDIKLTIAGAERAF